MLGVGLKVQVVLLANRNARGCCSLNVTLRRRLALLADL